MRRPGGAKAAAAAERVAAGHKYALRRRITETCIKHSDSAANCYSWKLGGATERGQPQLRAT